MTADNTQHPRTAVDHGDYLSDLGLDTSDGASPTGDTSAAERYREGLRDMPESGGGGCHAALLGVANLGRMAGLLPEQVFADLREHVHGSRPVPDREIRQAVEKAFDTKIIGTSWTPRPPPRVRSDALHEIIHRGEGATASDITKRSPVKIEPEQGAERLVLAHLYAPTDHLFLGNDTIPGIPDRSIRTASQWIEFLGRRGACPFPKIIPNPLTGELGLTKTGIPSYRADSCVRDFRFMVCEFDSIPLDQQYAFWAGCPHLPVAAIIHSGKKSLHAWVRVDCADAAEWTREVENGLFAQFLRPLGLDASCKNESRLSRMPGHIREDTGLTQRLLYLAPDGVGAASVPGLSLRVYNPRGTPQRAVRCPSLPASGNTGHAGRCGAGVPPAGAHRRSVFG